MLITMLKKMLQQLQVDHPEKIKNQIKSTILSSIKAFPEINPKIWKVVLGGISNNILLSAEKEEIMGLF